MAAPASSAPEWFVYFRTLSALIFVAGLIYFAGFFARRTGLDKKLAGLKAGARLSVVETLYLDSKRRVVILRSDDREHVLLLSAGGDVLVESRERRRDEQ